MLSAATMLPPPPVNPSWRSADLSQPGALDVMSAKIGRPAERQEGGFPLWEATLLSQIADLEDFADEPPGEYAYFGVDAPRSAEGARRATPVRWYNYDPAT